MKLQSSILLFTIPALVHAGCLSSDPDFTGVSGISCSYGQFKRGIKHEIDLRRLAGTECKKFKDELIDLFGGARINQIPSIFYQTCDQALRDSTGNFVGDFKDILHDSRFVKEFYDGNTYINQQVKQKRPTDFTFEEESTAIENFHDNVSKTGAVAMPDEYVDNFQQCDYNTVMCCYVSDRKVNGDGNGDCESPYPRASVPFDERSNCIDADPADNTDVCYVDHERSPQANHVDGGFTIFDGEVEGSTHCHGFVWSDNEIDASNRFKGNNLFYVSLRDHLKNRGYVRNVPGAPMCGCLEQMPTVSSSDCTETSVKDTFDFTYNQDSQDFTGTLVASKVRFDACTDANGNGIGLAAKYDQLKDEIEVESDVPFSDYIVGDDNCGGAIDSFLGTKGIKRAR